MDKFIGFDVDHKHTVVCVRQVGERDRFTRLPTDVNMLRGWLESERRPGDRLHLTFEVSGLAGYMYDELKGVVDRLEVGNPSGMTWIYRTVKKSDRVDARKQATLLMLGELPRVHMPPREVRDWRGMIEHRRKLIESATQTKNRIRALVKSQGWMRPPEGGWWTMAGRLWMDGLCEAGPEAWRQKLLNLLEELRLHERQAREVTLWLDERLRKMPAAKVLMSIKGVGPRTAEAVLAYTDEVNRFARGDRYTSYFGMVPRLDESGERRRLGHISKRGPSVVRWLIVESTWRVIRYNASLRAFYERVRRGQAKRRKIAIVATARKLLTIMRAMLRSGEAFDGSRVLSRVEVA